MVPVKIEKGMTTDFLLVKDQSLCCFGRMPRMNEWIGVRMAGDKSARFIGDRPVTVAVGALARAAIAAALDAGVAEAERMSEAGLIAAAMLQLRGERRIVGSHGSRTEEVPFDRGGDLPRGRTEGRVAPAPGRVAGGDPQSLRRTL
jgi:hypothetical protein